jgi:hypothetical protein
MTGRGAAVRDEWLSESEQAKHQLPAVATAKISGD